MIRSDKAILGWIGYLKDQKYAKSKIIFSLKGDLYSVSNGCLF